MECQSPVLIKERGKDIPSGDRGYIYVPCGRCFNCQMNKAREWAIRILQEQRLHEDSIFVTLTYAEENLPRVSDTQGTLVKRDLQNFMKKLRKAVFPRKIRFFACGEYGEKYARPHYHLILFGLSKADTPSIEKSWDFGFVDVGSVTFGSASYVARYTTKLLTKDKEKLYKDRHIQREFALMSRKPGIGVPFLNRSASFVKSHKYMRNGQFKVSVPRLYRSKIWQTEEDKQELREYMQKVTREISEAFAKEYGLPGWYAVRGSQQAAHKAKIVELNAKKRLSLNKKNPL